MKVRVTQDHIDRGVRHRGQACPLALALRRHHGGDWQVGATTASSERHERCEGATRQILESWRLSRAAAEFVRQFDAGEPVVPAEVELIRRSVLHLPPVGREVPE